jgi:hypothetical protein
MNEAALFQRRQQAMGGRCRQARADGKVRQAVSLIVLGQRLDDRSARSTD